MESGIIAHAGTVRHGRRTAEKVGIERAGTGRFSGAYERRATEEFAPRRRIDRPRHATREGSLSVCDRGTLCQRANGRRKRKDLSVDARKARRSGFAPSERCPCPDGPSVRFGFRRADKGSFRHVDRGMSGRGRMLYEFQSRDGKIAGGRRKGTGVRRNGFARYGRGGSTSRDAETRGRGSSVARFELARLCAESRFLRTGTAAFRFSGVRGVDWQRSGGRRGSPQR